MFSLLRMAAVIGAIFYFSPVRQGSFEDFKMASAAPESAKPEHLEAVWNALPESAKQAVIAKIVPAPATRSPQTDTLQPEDHRPAWAGPQKRPGA